MGSVNCICLIIGIKAVVLVSPFRFTGNAEILTRMCVAPYVFVKTKTFLISRTFISYFKPVTTGIDSIVRDRSAITWFVFSARREDQRDEKEFVFHTVGGIII